MTDAIASAVDRYVALWNQRSSESRTIDIIDLFSADATYTDPLVDVKGHRGIGAVITGVQGQFRHFTFKLLSAIDGHHRVARFSWELLPPERDDSPENDDSVAMGQEIVVFDDNWKIRSVYAFLDKFPSLEHQRY